MKIKLNSFSGTTWFLFFVSPILILVNFLLDWPLVKFSALSAGFNFADLLSTTSTIDCYREIGFDVYSATNAGYCGNYIYGRELLQIISKMPIYPSQFNTLGIIAVLLFCIITAIFTLSIRKPEVSTALFTVMMIASPGTFLLLERGNLDVFMILGVFFVAHLFSTNKFFSGYIVLTILTIFKFYTLPLFALILLFQTGRRERLFGITLFTFSTTLCVRSIASIQAGFPEGGYAQFGLNIIGNYMRRGLNLDVSHFEGRIFGYISFTLLLIGLGYFVNSKMAADSLILKKSEVNLFGMYSGIIFITCYIAGLSYDYRLPFMIFSYLWILNTIVFPKKLRIILHILAIFSAWFSTGFGSYFLPDNTFWQRYVIMGSQAIGDLAIWILAGFICIIAAQNARKLLVVFVHSRQKSR